MHRLKKKIKSHLITRVSSRFLALPTSSTTTPLLQQNYTSVEMSAWTLFTSSEVEGKRVRRPSIHICLAVIDTSSKQISAIAAFAGLSVEIKEGTSDIVKTPTLTGNSGFSVFEASAIGRYSESYRSYTIAACHRSPRISRRSLSHVRGMPKAIYG
jgi:hypothetical protein